MKFLVVEEQDGGCDYTIGCGICTSVEQGASLEEVAERIHLSFIATEEDASFDASHGHAADVDSPRTRITIYEITNAKSLPLAHWRNEYAQKKTAQKQVTSEARERAEYERLQKKFGAR